MLSPRPHVWDNMTLRGSTVASANAATKCQMKGPNQASEGVDEIVRVRVGENSGQEYGVKNPSFHGKTKEAISSSTMEEGGK